MSTCWATFGENWASHKSQHRVALYVIVVNLLNVKRSTIVSYESRVVLTGKLPKVLF